MQRKDTAAVAGPLQYFFGKKIFDTDIFGTQTKGDQADTVSFHITFVKRFDQAAGKLTTRKTEDVFVFTNTGSNSAGATVIRFPGSCVQASGTGSFCKMTVTDRTDHPACSEPCIHFRGK